MAGSRISAVAVALLIGAVGAQAQDHRVAFTAYVGSASYSDMATDAITPVLLAPGTFTGGQAEVWFQRFGFRLNGGHAGTSLSGEPGTGVSVMVADLDLVARLRWPRRGLFFQPYTVLGGGVVRYDLGTDALTLGGQRLASDPTTRGSVVLGLGTDLGSGPVAARIELMDIIGTSSPLTRDDGSRYSAVQHVVLTFGLTFRAGRVDLTPRPEPERRYPGPRTTSPPVQRPPVQQPPVQRPPVRRPRRPAADPAPDPAEPAPDPGPDGPPPGPPTFEPAPAVDTAGLPTIPARPIPGPEVDSGAPEPPDGPGSPGEPEDPAVVHGRLFTVRLTWDSGSRSQTAGAAEAAAELAAAGVPVWPVDEDEAGRRHSDVGALRNAAAANALGEHIRAVYGLPAAWVHIDRDTDVSAADVAASHAFVESLAQESGTPAGRAVGRGSRGGGTPRDGGPRR